MNATVFTDAKTTNEYSDYVFHILMISLGATFTITAIAVITHGLCKLRKTSSPIQPWPPRSRNGSLMLAHENPIHVLTSSQSSA
jgi:hypothetical protein